ncbi:hypothetical protein BGZ63DRAFT_230794 [Mariannaea sp. PMI_226]|nr:hypothetical protein BGZ63DRAFT_230794 [Mariannaea sp. PMI_226]
MGHLFQGVQPKHPNSTTNKLFVIFVTFTFFLFFGSSCWLFETSQCHHPSISSSLFHCRTTQLHPPSIKRHATMRRHRSMALSPAISGTRPLEIYHIGIIILVLPFHTLPHASRLYMLTIINSSYLCSCSLKKHSTWFGVCKR